MAVDFFNWDDSYSVGNIILDDQHKQLIKMLNTLYDAFLKDEHKEKLGLIILQMTDYTEIHFQTEERYFKQVDYEFSNEHINEHNSFILKIKDFNERFNDEAVELTYDMMNFLKDWLKNHILVSDQKYVKSFKKHKISK